MGMRTSAICVIVASLLSMVSISISRPLFVSVVDCWWLTSDQQVLYHCHGRTCRQDFKTLGALCNHLESESCGAMRFDRVQSTMTQLVDPTRRLVF